MFCLPFMTSPKHWLIISQHSQCKFHDTYCDWKQHVFRHQTVCRFRLCVYTLSDACVCTNSAFLVPSFPPVLKYCEFLLQQGVVNSCSVNHIGVISKRVPSFQDLLWAPEVAQGPLHVTWEPCLYSSLAVETVHIVMLFACCLSAKYWFMRGSSPLTPRCLEEIENL